MGNTVAIKYCLNCKSSNEGDAVYCENCGTPLPISPSTGSGVGMSASMERPPVRSSQKATVLIPETPEARLLADLTVIEGPGAGYGARFALKKERQKIGRGDGIEIRLNDETISREHACIWWEDGSFFIQDEVSKSGTKVNGQKIVRQTLADNDTIEIGKTKMVFRVILGTPSA